MRINWLSALVPVVLIGATGCPDVKVDPDEGLPLPTVEFDPSNRVIPFPNNLLINPMTGKVNLPAQCNESPASQATREQVLNQLDGFGTFEVAMSVTFTEPVDATSLAGNVLLFKRATGMTAVDPTTAMAIPVVTIPGMTTRFDADCMNPTMIDSVTIVPMIPLDQKSTYVVALKAGIKTAGGEDYYPSFVWGLVRQQTNPVTVDAMGNVVGDNTPLDPLDPADLATLQGINLLWNAHAQAMTFLRGTGETSEDILLAWEFRTQTVTDQLDPAVTGSPAAEATTTVALVGVGRANPAANGEQFLQAVLPANSCSADGGPLPCELVGEVLGGALLAKQFQVPTPNPLAGQPMIPGPWADPIMPPVASTATVVALATIPTAATCATVATTGCPTIVFGHGLGRSKEDVFAIASQLAAAGFNAVAIDAVAHGAPGAPPAGTNGRAVRFSDDAAIACDGTRVPATSPQCFAPFLSPNLAGTRDNIRQSIVDLHSLVAALKACGDANCGLLKVDTTRILYLGQSLGGIMGSAATATIPDIKASVLNVPGVGWVDILENTDNLTIRCSLVNGLIDAGILVGDKYNPQTMTGLCTTDAWKMQPGYRSFSAIGRWVLDPADPANFTRSLAAKRFLIQEVVGDTVVPNIATRNEGALTGVMPVAASCGGVTATASAAIAAAPVMSNKYLQYADLAVADCTPAGNAFNHGSILAPAAGTAGSLGTQQMQTDAITYLVQNR